MNQTGRFLIAAAISGTLAAPALLAQSAQPAQNQPAQDQYTGVSHPPPDDTIQANNDAEPPAAAPAPKPSAAVPMQAPAPAPAPAGAATPAPAKATVPEDPDYGIVTSVPAANAGNTDDDDEAGSPSLQKRGFNPDNDIVNVVPDDPHALNAATNIRVRLMEALSTTETEPGTAFSATVDRDIYKDGKVIIPAGSEMHGRVMSVSQGHHLGPHASLHLRPDYIVLPDRTAYHLHAMVVESDAPGTRADDEGGIRASSHYGKDAVEYGAGIGGGAVVGAAVAGPVGAGVGSLVGAGVMTTHMVMQHPQAADLPVGSVLIFSLTEPMPLTPAKN